MKKKNHISNSINRIRGKENLNDFIFMSHFCVTKNNSNL